MNIDYRFDLTKKSPAKTAVFDTRLSLTYGELADRAKKLAAFLAQEGVRRGDRIMVCLPNCCEMVELFFASIALGTILVPCNIQYKENELRQAVTMSKPAVAIMMSPDQVGCLRKIAPELKLIDLGPLGEKDLFDGLLPGEAQDYSFGVRGEDSALIVCTSGSTGGPKGVELTYGNLSIPAQDLAERFHMTGEDVSFIPVPLCHMFGIMGMLVAVLTGSGMVFCQRFRPEIALELLETRRVSVQYCVATMYEREIELYESLERKPKLDRLRTGMIAGAPSIRVCIEWFEKELGCRLLNAYGLTEVSALAMADYNDPASVRYCKVGKPCPHAELKIIRGDETEAETREVGEIVCRSPGVMLGYFGQPQLTRECYTKDGWFKTGDLGIIDEDGDVSVTGRKKDMIIRGGYNVIPYDVESVYTPCEGISEVSVVGYPDEALGERIAACIVLKDGYAYTPDELRQKAKDEIAKYKVPDRIVFLDSLPKLSNGKLDKGTLKKIVNSLH